MGQQIKILLILILIVGCKSKHKVTERTHEKKEIQEFKNTVDSTKQTIKENVLITSQSTEINISDNKDVELIQGDPNKQITVIDSQGRETIYRGANVIIRNNSKKQIKKDSTNIIAEKLTDTEVVQTDNTITTTKQESKKRTSEVEVEGFGFANLLWLLIPLAIYLLYRNRKILIPFI